MRQPVNPYLDLAWTVTKLALMILFAPLLMVIGWGPSRG